MAIWRITAQRGDNERGSARKVKGEELVAAIA